MKRLARILICMLFGSVLLCTAFAAEDGMSFKTYGVYKAEEPLSSVPATYEAWIKVPKGTSKDSIIFSNRSASLYNGFTFYVSGDGYLVLTFVNKVPNGAKTSKTYTFSEVNLANGEWTHVAITHDLEGETVSCYINGELTGTKPTAFVPGIAPLPIVLGGNHTSGNNYYFKGQIKSATLYSVVRSADEIKADMESVKGSDKNLMAYYDLSDEEFGKDITDLAGNYDMIYDPFWVYDASNEPEDYAYSIAVIGDQQVLVGSHKDKLHYMYDWILANKESKKIGYVVAVGDVAQNRDNLTEWALVQAQFKRLDGFLPLIACKGNHDRPYSATTGMNYEGYTKDIVGRYNDVDLESIYKTVKLGNTDYLIISLDYGPSDDILEWANEVTAAHPDHKVIVVTHAYLEDDGTLLDKTDGDAPTNLYSALGFGYNNGDDIWNKYVRKHENIVLVLSGHVVSDKVLTTKAIGDNGNVVTQMLINPQSIDIYNPSGLVCMLYFNEDGNIMTTEYYSTIKQQYYNVKENHYTVLVGERSGDMDGDGKVKLPDALAALRAWLDGDDTSGADINGDGDVTLSEVVSILKLCAK